MEDRESMKLGPYHLVRRLARGGMSEVHLASDERDEQIYALKMVRQRDEEDCQRFQQEVQVLMRLEHPHILPILDSGSQEDICYYVMPYIANGTVKDRLKRGPVSEKEAEIILTQVADALQFLHEAGLVHRDVKPSNILQDETNHVWLADFGLVRVIEGGSDLTRTGYLLGTPAYMAPELEKTQASANSDVYSLGVVLYEMLTGHVPFTGETLLDVYLKQVFEQPPSLSAINPLISPAIEQVVLHALEKHPADRYPSARALTEAYQQALLVEANAASPGGRVGTGGTDTFIIAPATAITHQKQGRVRRTPLALGALIAMALLTLSLVSMEVVSHGGFSLIPGSAAHAVHAADVSPTRTSPHSGTTPTSASSTLSGSAPSGGTPPPSGNTPPSGGTPPSAGSGSTSSSGGTIQPAESSATPGSTSSGGTPSPAESSVTPGSTPPEGITPTPGSSATPVPSVTPSPSTTPVSTPTASGKQKKKPKKN